MKEDSHIVKLISISFDKIVFSGILEMEKTIETNFFEIKKISDSQIMIIDEMEKHVVLMNEIFSINHNHYVFIDHVKRFQILTARFDLSEREILFQRRFFPFLNCILNHFKKINSRIFFKFSFIVFEIFLFIFLINLFFINRSDSQSEEKRKYDFSSYIEYMQTHFKEEKENKIEKDDDKNKKEFEIMKGKYNSPIKYEKENKKIRNEKRNSNKKATEKDEELDYFVKMLSGRKK